MSQDDRIAEPERQLAERDAELKRLREQLEKQGEVIEAWKRGHRTRPGGKKAQRKAARDGCTRSPGRSHGHRGAGRTAPASVDREVTLPPPPCCPDCGGDVQRSPEPARRQRVEEPRPQPAVETVAYVRPQGRCVQCNKRVLASLPYELGPNAKVGPKMQARIVEQKSEGLSLAQVQRECKRAGLSISRGGIQQFLHRCATAMAPRGDQIKNAIQHATHRWMDETSHRIRTHNGWLWLARTRDIVWFEHAESRSAEVAQAMIGDRFRGVIHSDFYAAYWTIEGAEHAPCWAHTIRTATQIAERTELPEALEVHQSLQRLDQRAVRSQQKPSTAERNAQALSQGLRELGRNPQLRVHSEIERLQKRLRKRAKELAYFATERAAEGTNNSSGRTLRPHAMSRARCGPARSSRRAKTYAMNLTATHTLAAQHVAFADALCAARAHHYGRGKFPTFIAAPLARH